MIGIKVLILDLRYSVNSSPRLGTCGNPELVVKQTRMGGSPNRNFSSKSMETLTIWIFMDTNTVALNKSLEVRTTPRGKIHSIAYGLQFRYGGLQ